jgi:hypothetical protein
MDARCHSTSAPAQKASPSPERTTRARVADVGERLGQLGDQAASKAFRRSGRASVHAQDRARPLSTRSALMCGQLKVRSVIHGPWRGGDAPSGRRGTPRRGRVRPIVDFLAGRGETGWTGILALGTTGEGSLLSATSAGGSPSSTSRPAGGRLDVAVHCGAQTTAKPRRSRARRGGRSGGRGGHPAAVLPVGRRRRSSSTSAPPRTPAPPSLSISMSSRRGAGIRSAVRHRAPALGSAEPRRAEGLRYAFSSASAVSIEGLDIFIGSEPLSRGLAQGAAGTVSGSPPPSRTTSPALPRARSGRRGRGRAAFATRCSSSSSTPR